MRWIFVTVAKEGKRPGCGSQGAMGCLQGLGPFQTFRGNWPRWQAPPPIHKAATPSLSFRGPCSRRCQCACIPFTLAVGSGICTSRAPPTRRRRWVLGMGALPARQQPSASDWEQRTNPPLASELCWHSVQLWGLDFGETQNCFVGHRITRVVRFFFCDISQYSLHHFSSQ